MAVKSIMKSQGPEKKREKKQKEKAKKKSELNLSSDSNMGSSEEISVLYNQEKPKLDLSRVNEEDKLSKK